MYIHIKGYYSVMEKKRNITICENMDEPRGHYASEISHMAISKMLYNFTHK